MILWTIRQLLALRKAIAGRANPSELAWGLALGVAIGLIPKGNLIAVFLIGFVVTLKVNHGLTALAAVVCTLFSGYLDPLSHLLGSALLETPSVRRFLDQWWDAPLVAWTDLNNTVVMGSGVFALVTVVPTYVISLPIFRWLAPRKKVEADTIAAEGEVQDQYGAEHLSEDSLESNTSFQAEEERSEAEAVVVETQIDVIRISEYGTGQSLTVACDDPHATSEQMADTPDPDDSIAVKQKTEHGNPQANAFMNDALRYLLNRMRDTEKEGRAA